MEVIGKNAGFEILRNECGLFIFALFSGALAPGGFAVLKPHDEKYSVVGKYLS